jgi:LPXTG-motif cell wall-anchored protein
MDPRAGLRVERASQLSRRHRMARPTQNQGLTGLGLLALGAAAFGAYKWRKNERAKGTYDGNGDGLSDTTGQPIATAKDINVGTTATA